MVKVKQRARALTKNVAAAEMGIPAGEFSFRGSATGSHTPNKTGLMSRSLTRDKQTHPYMQSQGGKYIYNNGPTNPLTDPHMNKTFSKGQKS